MTYRLGNTKWKNKPYLDAFESEEVNKSHTERELLAMGAVEDTPPQIEEIDVPENIIGSMSPDTPLITSSPDFRKWAEQITEAVNTLTQKESK